MHPYQKKKKAQLQEFLVGIIIAVIVIVLLVFLLTYSILPFLNLFLGTQSCLVASTVADSFSLVGIKTSLPCTARYVPCLHPVEGDTLPTGGGSSGDSELESSEMYKLTSEMYRCWEQFGKGKLNVRSGGFLESDTHCFVCAKFKYGYCKNEKDVGAQSDIETNPLTGEGLYTALMDFKPATEKIESLQLLLQAFPEYNGQPYPFILEGNRTQTEAPSFHWNEDWNNLAVIGTRLQYAIEDGFAYLYDNDLNVSMPLDHLEKDKTYAIIYWQVPAESKERFKGIAATALPGRTWEGARDFPVSYVFITPEDNLENLACDHVYS